MLAVVACPVLVAVESSREDELATAALELLVSSATEYFFAVQMVHLDVKSPALARQNGLTLFVRASVVVFVYAKIFFIERLRIDAD